MYILAVSVLYILSRKVPTPMAAAKTKKSIAINRVEKSVFFNNSNIWAWFSACKITT
jgi:hypothetical protein